MLRSRIVRTWNTLQHSLLLKNQRRPRSSEYFQWKPECWKFNYIQCCTYSGTMGAGLHGEVRSILLFGLLAKQSSLGLRLWGSPTSPPGTAAQGRSGPLQLRMEPRGLLPEEVRVFGATSPSLSPLPLLFRQLHSKD